MKVWAVKACDQGMGEDYYDKVEANGFGNDPADPIIIPEDMWKELGFGDEPVYIEIGIKRIRVCKQHRWYYYRAVNGKDYQACEKCGMCIPDRRKSYHV